MNSKSTFSKECLKQALFELMAHKKFEEITITELTEKAGVSRPCFYRNYNDKIDIINEYLQTIVTAFEKNKDKIFGNESYNTYLLLYKEIKSHEKYIKTIYNASIINSSTILYNVLITNKSHYNLPYIEVALFGALNAILTKWIINNMKDPIEEMAKVSTRITKAYLETIVE